MRSLHWKIFVSILGIVVSGCWDSGYKRVDFSATLPIEKPHQEPTLAGSRIRVAVAAMISPKDTFIYYNEMLDYIGEKLGLDIHMVQRKTYTEINELFSRQQLDLAFICTGPYTSGQQAHGFEALATPVVLGSPLYRAYLIVHKNSDFRNLEDLRERVFAFTDPESNTGNLVPNFWLTEIGSNPSEFFAKTTYTYSHDNSIMAVARGLVDGAAVDGHIWDFYNLRNPQFTELTRVIKKSEPFGSPPLVISNRMDENLKQRLAQLVLTMHEDPAGAEILKNLMIDRFVAPVPSWYEPVQAMNAYVRQKEF